MNEYDINDMRKEKEFLGITFSKFKMSDVKKELIKDILGNDFEGALYWSGELICSGHFKELWEIILSVIGKNIHLGNIKLPIYIQMKIDTFKEILSNGYIDNEIKMRNNVKIRELFAEIITILTLSNKKNSLERVKINRKEFDITNFGGRLKADHVNYAKDVFLKEDPKELLIAINEFCYSIHPKVCNMLNACYWIEWIIEYDNISRKKKDPLLAESRLFAPNKFQKDVVWIIWEIIMSNAKNKLHKRCIESLIELFALKYTYATKKKRKSLLYLAIELLVDNKDTYPDIITSKVKQIIHVIPNNLDKIYKIIKTHEVAPKTDYLFHGVEQKSNQEKTAEKLAILNKLI